jgi:hypothetical protein
MNREIMKSWIIIKTYTSIPVFFFFANVSLYYNSVHAKIKDTVLVVIAIILQATKCVCLNLESFNIFLRETHQVHIHMYVRT